MLNAGTVLVYFVCFMYVFCQLDQINDPQQVMLVLNVRLINVVTYGYLCVAISIFKFYTTCWNVLSQGRHAMMKSNLDHKRREINSEKGRPI